MKIEKIKRMSSTPRIQGGPQMAPRTGHAVRPRARSPRAQLFSALSRPELGSDLPMIIVNESYLFLGIGAMQPSATRLATFLPALVAYG